MKKVLLLCLSILVFGEYLFSQPCLPDGITFSSQTQIDSFQINYPNCTEIGGTLTIRGNTIKDLSNLNVITSIERSLSIYENDSLETLVGLENLSEINEVLSIKNNKILKNLEGLNNINSIGVWLRIHNNDSIEYITALSNLNSIGEIFEITDNKTLKSLTGLDNVEFDSIGYFEICNNDSLSYCNVDFVCNYLSDPNGKIRIYNNAPGCNNPPEIADSCGFTMPCLPFGDYLLSSQAEIDNFQQDYPDCYDLNGSLVIVGDDINNLNGLNTISAVEKTFTIDRASYLKNLTGLGSLVSIGNDFWLQDNLSLKNLNGLNNLTSIGNDFYLWGNDSLINLEGLESLTQVEGALYFWYNNMLSSLSGIDNINPIILKQISIRDNPSLSECEVMSVCFFIYFETGDCYFHDNAIGCNSLQEVEEACKSVGIKEKADDTELFIYPNPASSFVNIKIQDGTGGFEINIYNQFGQKIFTELGQNTMLNVSSLSSGIYVIEYITNEK